MPDTLPTPKSDPYEILGIPKDASDDQIKSAYRKLALKYHPDKNANDADAAELFKEVSYSYSILSDPEKRKLYDISGVVSEGSDMGLDLSNLGTVNTMFAALFSKLGIPIKTSISDRVLEEAINGVVTIRPLPLGRTIHDRVEKQEAHFYGLTISDIQAQEGIVIRVTSAAQSKFKLLYFEQEDTGRLDLTLQEDSVKTGNVTSAGMYFLNFQVYRIDMTANPLAIGKDTDDAFFRKLDGLQPCEVSSLKEGTHILAVYGDNFFKSASYAIEAVCAKHLADSKEKLKEVESQMLRKRDTLHEFEAEYKEVSSQFNSVTNRYKKEKEELEQLLKQWEAIKASFASSSVKRSTSSSNIKFPGDDVNAESLLYKEDTSLEKDRSQKKRWFDFRTDKKP